jgi:hypothetical protein
MPAMQPVERYLRKCAATHDLRLAEVAELLERLPHGETESGGVPEVWQRPAAHRLLEAYAARRRAVARLARRGGFGSYESGL